MRRNFLFASFLLGVLLLAPPAYPIPYLGQASLDWTSLTYSGIPITITGMDQSFHAAVTASSPSSPGTGGFSFFPDWSNRTFTATIPEVGVTAVSSADASRLFASVSMLGTGFGVSETGRGAHFTAMETGNLSVSVQYTLSHANVPTLQSDFLSQAFARLSIGAVGSSNNVSERTLSSALGNGIQTGTLSVTRSFQAGEQGAWSPSVQVVTTGSVPEPNMLWPTLAVLLGFALWQGRRLCSNSCSA